jgi:hypothetical protein
MPSPFPGMDPYLEGSIWSSVHTTLTTEIARQLAPKLRIGYVVLVTERFDMELTDEELSSSRIIIPDVSIAEDTPWPSPVFNPASGIIPAPLTLNTMVVDREPQFSIEIQDLEDRKLVTAIELLSPSNKQGSSRAEYLAKRNGILFSDANLLEIDLLRGGKRVPIREPLPPTPYFVFLSRAEERPATGIWPISLREPLPKIGVPLRRNDGDVELDLQAALTSMIETFRYDALMKYNKPLSPPLQGDDALWAAERIRQHQR